MKEIFPEDTRGRCDRLEQELEKRFGPGGPVRFFRAPGRVDLMGSHTDYNLGLILAGAVDREIVAAARLRPDGQLNFYSQNLDQEVRTRLPQLRPEPAHGWANYPKGVIHELNKLGFPLTGLDLAVHGTIPVGGNLSSSAALEAVTARAVLDLLKESLAAWEIIHLCRRAETDFVGLPCGILDQFTVIMGRPDTALFLDCRSLEYERFHFPADQAALVVINSGVGRELVVSEYAARVAECQKAAEHFRRYRPRVQSLREVTEADLEAIGPLMPETLFRRARHVVTENGRVREAAAALSRADMAALGRIMEAGFQSSRDDYQISIPELDRLHGIASSLPGVLGTRIAGAGWGGCLVSLLQPEVLDNFMKKVVSLYRDKTGRQASAMAVRLGGGPEEIRAEASS
jgi:galactokinase